MKIAIKRVQRQAMLGYAECEQFGVKLKTFMTNIKTLAALLIAGAAMTACSSDESTISEQPTQPATGKYTMIVRATKGGASREQNGTRSSSAEAQPALGEAKGDGATTRGLTLSSDGKTISPKWYAGEEVKVYDNYFIHLGTLKADASDNGTTTLRGELNGAPTGVLYFCLHDKVIDFTGQKGVLLISEDAENAIEKKYDIDLSILHAGEYTVDNTTVTVTADNVVFGLPSQAIVKFILQDTNGNAIPATSLKIKAESDDFASHYDCASGDVTTTYEMTITPDVAKSELYVSIRLEYENREFKPTLIATTASGDLYTYSSTASVSFTKGKYYVITVKMKKETMAAAATAADKGKLICTEGHIHAYNKDGYCKAARVAKIIYVGTTGHATYTHGLALALEDVSTNTLSWDNSGAYNGGKTAAEWCSAWNTSKPVKDAEWLLASDNQWGYMLGTNGANGYQNLRGGFENFGGSNLQEGCYWSSTEDSGMYGNAWARHFGSGASYSSPQGTPYYVRAALAF